MKLKEIILKKVPLYLNQKYYDLFFNILSNIKELMIEEDKKMKKISLFEFEKKSYIQFTKNTIYKYFYEIDKAINKTEIYNNEIYSQLELSYLKKKAKLYFRKLNLISIESRKSIDYCIKYYIGFCKYEIKKQHKNLFLFPSRTETMKSIFKRDIRRKTSINHTFSRKNTLKNFEKDNEDNQNDFLFDADENKEKKKFINLFIGKFDIKKIMSNEQKIELKKGGFVNAFIFKNLNNNDENENKLFHFIKNSKKKYNKVISPIKTYRENRMNKFHNYLNNNKLTNEESSYDLSSKNLFKKKNKKNLILTTSYNNLYLSKNYLHFNKNKKLSLSPNSFISNNEKSNKISSYENKSLENIFKKLPKLNKKVNSNSKNKNNSNILNYLSKNDLYY